MPATQRQRRYEQLMGEREPDVTDKKFVHELQTRLEIKYYESQLAKEKQLAESEKKRIRKLIMEGLMHGDDRRQGQKDQREAEWKEYWPPNPGKTLQEYEEEKRRAEEKQQKEEAAAEDGRRQDGEDNEEDVAAAGQDPANARTERSVPAAATAAGKYTRVQSARILALQEEKDLDQLYQKASELVYIMAPVARSKAKKQQ